MSNQLSGDRPHWSESLDVDLDIDEDVVVTMNKEEVTEFMKFEMALALFIESYWLNQAETVKA